MRRRSVLRAVAGLSGLTGLAGCGQFPPDEWHPEDARATRSTSAPSADAPTPYRDSDPADNVSQPRAIRVENRTRREWYVTVAVDEGERMVALRNATVPPGATVSHSDLVAKRGVYALTVDTDRGTTAVREFVVGEGVSDLDVVLGRDGIRTRQTAHCWPECSPVSTGGVVADALVSGTTALWRGAGRLLVRNVDTQTRRIRVRLWSERETGGERLLDYRYRVPAGMRLVLPLVVDGGRYEVAVSVDGRTLRRPWYVPEEPVAEFEVGAGVSAVCDAIGERSTRSDGPFRLAGVVNDDDVPHHLFVAVHHRGSVVLDAHYVVEAGETVDVGFETFARSDVELVARTGGGEDLVVTWTDCPPPGDLFVVVDDRGRLRTDVDRRRREVVGGS